MKPKFYCLLFTRIILIGCLFSSCDRLGSNKKGYEPSFSVDSTHKKVLTWGVNTPGYYELFGPLINYLNARIKNIHIQLIGSSNFEDYVRRLGKKEFDITTLSGILALDQERNGYTIVGKVEDDNAYRGIILVNKDSAINGFRDLSGKTISSPGKDALAGHMLPMYFLHQNGVNVKTGIHILNLGSFESVILNVYHGNCAAGFCMRSRWEAFIKKRPEIQSKVALKWTTPSMTNVALVFRNDMDAKIREELKTLLFSMHTTAEGKKALEPYAVNQFVPANTSTYAPLKKFLENYNAIFQ
jgi:phosphonate transport system substrate-binding protein